MSDIVLFYRIRNNVTTFTAETQNVTAPASNLRDNRLARAYVTGITQAAEGIEDDFAASNVTNDTVAIVGHDLTSGDSGLILSADTVTPQSSSPSFSQAVTFQPINILVQFAAKTLRYWRFDFTKSASGETRKIGKILIGSSDSFTTNVRAGIEWGSISTDKIDRTKGGQLHGDIGADLRTVTLTFSGISKLDANIIRDLGEATGIISPFVVSIDPTGEPTDFFLYGTLQALPRRREIRDDLWDVQFTMIEQL